MIKTIKFVSFFFVLVILLLNLTDLFVPTAKYYLKYHAPFYRGLDNSNAELAQDIPYDAYLYEMTVDDAKELTGFVAVYNGDIGIQSAVNYASAAGGGIVTVFSDLTVEKLELKSNVCLFVNKGVTLTITGYRKISGSTKGENEADSSDAFRFIEADSSENVFITGGGTIKGTGKEYWNEANLVTITEPIKNYNINVLEYIHFQQKMTRKEDISTKFFVFNRCKGITVDNIVIFDSPGWNLSVEASSNVKISNLVISSNYHGANTDGIDISATSNVFIEHCYLSVGDDAVCLKNDKYYNDTDDLNMNNIIVCDCFIRSATNGFKIGTGVYNDISDVTVSNLVMDVTGIYPPTIGGITILVSEGGKLENVSVLNVTMNNVLAPVFIRLSNRNKFGDQSMTGAMKSISVKNITATNTELPIIVAGVEDDGKICYAEDITLKNINVTYREATQAKKLNRITDSDVDEAADEYPEAWMMGDVPASGIYIRHAKNITVDNCNFVLRSEDKREKIKYFDVE